MSDKPQYQTNTFFSAVNRIPRYPKYAREHDEQHNEEIYTSGNTPHLDHLHASRMSGYFDLELQSRTPLIVGKQTKEGKKHLIEVQITKGKPFISPTMIKGLLSSTYERLTSSRFRIFDTPTHSTPLEYRAGKRRKRYTHAPNKVAKSAEVQPAQSYNEASAAERLFGFVGKEEDTGAALRGRLKIGPISISTDAIAKPDKGKSPLPLPPLLSPKPSSGRRFLFEWKNFPDTVDSHQKRALLFDPTYFLLGEAAYPTHRSCIDQSLEAIIKQHSNSGGDLTTNESVELRVKSWIKEKSTLKCRVHFEDLSPKELAFLLWPLVPENLSPSDKGNFGFHKIGIGKPLGLGLVEARIVNGYVYVQTTDDLASGYKNLSCVLGTTYEEKSVSQLIREANIGDLSKLPWIRAFQRIAYGFDDNKDTPVRYVNLEENKVNNETTDDGSPKCFADFNWRAGRAPRPLWLNDTTPTPDVFLVEVKTEQEDEKPKGGRKKVDPAD